MGKKKNKKMNVYKAAFERFMDALRPGEHVFFGYKQEYEMTCYHIRKNGEILEKPKWFNLYILLSRTNREAIKKLHKRIWG